MKPRLYQENEVEFISNGLGPLSEAQSCTVEENRNGSFELTMEYPVTGGLFAELKNGAIVMAKPNDTSEQQAFRIYNITTPLHGVVTVYARHISYQLSHIPVSPFVANSCAAAMQGLKANAAEACPFEFWTDKETVAAFSSKVPASARSLLGGVTGSILDTFGGEYEFDMWAVKLHRQRGKDSGVVIAYGKNLTDLDQEKSIENTITGIYPYYCDAATGEVMELPEKVVSSPSAENFPYPRTVPLDCSSEWNEMPTVEQLRDYATQYVQREGIGVPKVSLKVSFWPLWQSEEFGDIAPVEKLALCDTVTVRFARLGVDAKAKVVGTVYDVLAGRYESITLGEAATNLADTIVKQEKQLQEVPDESSLEAAAARATNWITGNKGGYVLLRRNANGQPYELLIMDTDDITTAKKVWRFNQSGLGYSSTGYNGTYGLAMTQDGQIVADYITTGKLSANLVQAGVLQDKTGKKFRFDLDTGEVEANYLSLNIVKDSTNELEGQEWRSGWSGTHVGSTEVYGNRAIIHAEQGGSSGAVIDVAVSKLGDFYGEKLSASIEYRVTEEIDFTGSTTTEKDVYITIFCNYKDAAGASKTKSFTLGKLTSGTNIPAMEGFVTISTQGIIQKLSEDFTIARVYIFANCRGCRGTLEIKNPVITVGNSAESIAQLSVDGRVISSNPIGLKGYVSNGDIRTKFAADDTTVTIDTGVLTFNSNSIVINSDNFKLREDGSVEASGVGHFSNLTVGKIGGDQNLDVIAYDDGSTGMNIYNPGLDGKKTIYSVYSKKYSNSIFLPSMVLNYGDGESMLKAEAIYQSGSEIGADGSYIKLMSHDQDSYVLMSVSSSGTSLILRNGGNQGALFMSGSSFSLQANSGTSIHISGDVYINGIKY